MSLSNEASAILDLLSSTGARLTIKTIAEKLTDLQNKAGAIEELIEAGLIWHAGKGRYATLHTLGMEKGTLRSRSDGSGLVFTTGPDPVRIEIQPGRTAGALDGDTVLVRLLEPELNSGGYQGGVVHIPKRFRNRMAGIARQHSGKWFLDPLDPRIPGNIPLDPCGEHIAQGDLISCSIDYGKTAIRVSALGTVGSSDSPRALIDSVCIDLGLPEEFPEHTAQEALEVSASPHSNPARKDLRHLHTITIDPADARDFDDAISIERIEDGGYRLGVHIADVSAFAPPGSAVDREAYARGTSVYLPDRVIPMIPEILSNGACSLQPDQDRLTKSVIIDYDDQGKRKGFSVFSSTIRSRKRLNYTEALEILQGGGCTDSELAEGFRLFAELNLLLDRARMVRGAVDLGSSEFRTVFNDAGFPDGFAPVSDDVSHRMIENFMVEANSAVAEFCGWLELDVLYRVHGDPAPEASEKLRRTLSIYGFSMPGQLSPTASSLSKAVEQAEGTALYPLVRDAVLRSMQRAVYSPVNDGHYGLALRNYMHFTSPIRRYPDLVVHQAISAYEQGKVALRDVSMSTAAESCSFLERRADNAERTSTELMALLYLSKRTGEVFRGVVRDSVDFGLFVRLLDVPVEGLVHVSAIRNHTGSVPAEPGSSILVAVEKADPFERKLSLLPAESVEGDRIE